MGDEVYKAYGLKEGDGELALASRVLFSLESDVDTVGEMLEALLQLQAVCQRNQELVILYPLQQREGIGWLLLCLTATQKIHTLLSTSSDN